MKHFLQHHRLWSTQNDLITICDSILQDGLDRSYSSINNLNVSQAAYIPKIPMIEKKTLHNEPSTTWHVYMVCCKDNSYYTGITTDLSRRIDEHNSHKKGARYTRSRRPVELVYSEKAASRSIATRRECQIKKLTLTSKKQLIKAFQPVKAWENAKQPKS